MKIRLDMIPAGEIRTGDTLLNADEDELGKVTRIEVAQGRGAVAHKTLYRVTYTATVEMYEMDYVAVERDTH